MILFQGLSVVYWFKPCHELVNIDIDIDIQEKPTSHDNQQSINKAMWHPRANSQKPCPTWTTSSGKIIVLGLLTAQHLLLSRS